MIISKMLTEKDLNNKVTSMTTLFHGRRLITKLFKYDNLNRPIECKSIHHCDNTIDLITIFKNKYDKNNNVVYASSYNPIKDKFAEIHYVYNEYNKITIADVAITKSEQEEHNVKEGDFVKFYFAPEKSIGRTKIIWE